MNATLRAYFELVRAPNLPTAMADVLAGFLFVGGRLEAWPSLACLMIASACLYAGGVALNDVCDAVRDAEARPGRPIPSGRISRRRAATFAVTLLLCGLALAFLATRAVAVPAVILVAAIILYNVAVKQTALAPALMGVCRAANLALGMAMAPIAWSIAAWPVALMGVYITFVTYFARGEAIGGNRFRLAVGAVGAWAAVAGLTSLAWVVPNADATHLMLVVLVLGVIGRRACDAIRGADPQSIQKAVRAFVLAIVLFDACVASAARGPWAALAVGALLLPALALSRKWRVT